MRGSLGGSATGLHVLNLTLKVRRTLGLQCGVRRNDLRSRSPEFPRESQCPHALTSAWREPIAVGNEPFRLVCLSKIRGTHAMATLARW